MTTNTTKAKPEIIYFFSAPYKCYCGNCKRLMAIGCRTMEEAKATEKCKWCNMLVDWN